MKKDKNLDDKMLDNMPVEDGKWYGALLLLLDYANNEWESYRNLASNSPKSPEIFKYFDKLFNSKINEYNLQKGSHVFRARVIKSNNVNEIGLSNDDIIKMYSTLLSDEDMNFSLNGVKSSPSQILLAKYISGKKFTIEQENKFKKILSKYKEKNFYGFKSDGCGVPPLKYRKEGRLNDKKDEYLYLSLEKDTCLYEMRPSINQIYCIAEGITTKSLKLINFRDYCDISYSSIFTIIDKIAETNTDEDESFYYITQELAHYIHNKGYDGILYKSAIKSNGSNILLFNQDDVNFICSSIVNVVNIQIDYNQVLPIVDDNNEQ